MLKVQPYNHKYHYKPYKLMQWTIYIYLFKSSLRIIITNKSRIKSLSTGVIKLTRLEPPLAAAGTKGNGSSDEYLKRKSNK